MHKICLQRRILYILLAMFIAWAYATDLCAEIIDKPGYLIYLPDRRRDVMLYPLVVALSPSADAQSMINAWKGVADKFKLMVLASKEFKNGVDMNSILRNLSGIVQEASINFPVDRSKIIATGFSGGAMGAHAFIFTYPNLISAVVINTGMMHEYYFERKFEYPRNKLVVFLASPADFRYGEMKRDKEFLESIGWKTKWIEFNGGHAIAPNDAYQQAAGWLVEQLKIR